MPPISLALYRVASSPDLRCVSYRQSRSPTVRPGAEEDLSSSLVSPLTISRPLRRRVPQRPLQEQKRLPWPSPCNCRLGSLLAHPRGRGRRNDAARFTSGSGQASCSPVLRGDGLPLPSADGNFPQALTHFTLINTARNITRNQERRTGTVDNGRLGSHAFTDSGGRKSSPVSARTMWPEPASIRVYREMAGSDRTCHFLRIRPCPLDEPVIVATCPPSQVVAPEPYVRPWPDRVM